MKLYAIIALACGAHAFQWQPREPEPREPLEAPSPSPAVDVAVALTRVGVMEEMFIIFTLQPQVRYEEASHRSHCSCARFLLMCTACFAIGYACTIGYAWILRCSLRSPVRPLVETRVEPVKVDLVTSAR